LAMEKEEEKEPHIKLRCTRCGAKFDSKYDKVRSVGIFRVGDVHQNLLYCEKCKRRADVRVVEVR